VEEFAKELKIKVGNAQFQEGVPQVYLELLAHLYLEFVKELNCL